MKKKRLDFSLLINLLVILITFIVFESNALTNTGTFSASFVVRDRTVKNRVVFNGVMNVRDENWEQAEVILESAGSEEAMPNNSTSTLYYYHGQVVQIDGKDETDPICRYDHVNIPSLPILASALGNRRAFSVNNSTNVFDREVAICAKQQSAMFEISFMGEAFVVCAQTPSLKPVRVIGRDVVIDIVTLTPNHMLNWVTDKVKTPAMNCIKQRPLQVSKINSALLNMKGTSWYSSYKDSCRNRWTRDPVLCKQYEDSTAPLSRSIVAKSEPTKICVFLHGVGNTQEEAGPPVHEYEDYWGKVQDYTPQCKERWFIREETKSRGWDNLDLQTSFCKMALVNQTEGDTVIRDKILFVHSMGNLILADAIRNGLCDIDNSTTSWYEIQGPLKGSKAAYELQLICLYIYNGEWVRHLTPRFVKWVAVTGGYCVPGTNETYPAYDTLAPTYPNIMKLTDIVSSRVKGSMCGDSAYGLNSIYSAALYSLAFYVEYGDINDGMVPISSCGDYDFSVDYTSKYYLATINHADGTCRNSDGYWGISRKPCSWYIDKV